MRLNIPYKKVRLCDLVSLEAFCVDCDSASQIMRGTDTWAIEVV